MAILDDEAGTPETLPVAEIVSNGAFFDFQNKYEEGVAEEIVPASLPGRLASSIQQTALRIHELAGAHAMSRTDFMLRDDGTLVFLEINTIPGLTPNSLLPKAAAAVGIDFRDVLTRLIEGAVRGRMPAWSASFPRCGVRSTGSSTATNTAARSSS